MWLNEQGDGRRYKKKVKLSACYKETNVHSKKSDNHFILKVKNHLSPQDWAVLAVWMERGGVFIIALNRQLHMQPWGRHRENLWLVWDCSHLTEGKLLNEKFLCLFDRFVTRKRKILLVKYDRMQIRRCSLWIFAWIYWIIVAVWIQIAKKKKKKSFQSIHLWAEGVTLWKSCSLFYLRDGLLSDVEILFATQQMQNSHQHCFMNNTNKAAQLPFQHE